MGEFLRCRKNVVYLVGELTKLGINVNLTDANMEDLPQQGGSRRRRKKPVEETNT
jgi:hypothetical protein